MHPACHALQSVAVSISRSGVGIGIIVSIIVSNTIVGTSTIITIIVAGGTKAINIPPQGVAETHLSEMRGALVEPEAQGTTGTLVQGGNAAAAGAQTEAVRRGARRVGLEGRQQPHQV